MSERETREEDSTWVTHQSGQGPKWKVVEEERFAWILDTPSGPNYRVAKSEYVRCDPPTQWENVTDRMTPPLCQKTLRDTDTQAVVLDMLNGYQLRKIMVVPVEEPTIQSTHTMRQLSEAQWAYIVERPVAPYRA